MLGVSFFELLVIIFIVLVVTKPSDIPHFIATYRKFIKKAISVKNDLSENFHQVHNEIIGIDSDKSPKDAESHYVLDDKGKLHKTYDAMLVKGTNHKNKKI
jgi:Sec-independent protein translocase protein TatA